jgi:DNA-binding transcriptional MerR regulator
MDWRPQPRSGAAVGHARDDTCNHDGVVLVTTTEMLNSLIERAGTDGLPDLNVLLASSVSVDDAPALPMTVGEVAELLGVSGHTLRYYERVGLVKVGRSGSGQRRYDRDALARVIFITRLRWAGMPIRDIGAYFSLVEQGNSTLDQRLDLLHRHRERVCRQIEELQFALAVIDYKITTYDQLCAS